MEEYNTELCEERHSRLDVLATQTATLIKEMRLEFNMRMKKLENRFLTIMTALSLNLVGVILVLIIMYTKK